MEPIRLLLASASPRRLELLRGANLAPRVAPAPVDERALPDEPADRLVARLAEAKGRAALQHVPANRRWLVLAADTAVVIEGRALGKPRDEEDALAMLRLLRDRTHEVLTGVFLLRSDDGRYHGGIESTRVSFLDYDERTARDYVASGEPMDKAGAYAIQGGGRRLVRHVDGSWSNVVGLPMERLPGWLGRVGLTLDELAADDG
jgi:septum formation protein